MATMQDIINGFKDPRTLKMPLSNTPEFNNPSPTTSFPIQGRPVQSVPFPKLDRSKPHTVNYWPTYGANDPSGGVPYLPAPMPKPMSMANAPSVGNYTPYAPTPNNGGDPNRLPPGGLPFINKPPLDITVRGGAPQIASIPMPRGRPGLNIQPFDQQFNLRDPGNEGYVDPATAYAPPAAAPQNPAVAAATGAGQGQPPQTSWVQDMMTGINSLLPGYQSPRDMSRAQMYDATNAAAADAARTQDRSGFGTDGYVRDASGNVIGRDAQYNGLTPSQMYDQINGNSGPARIDGNPDNDTFSGSSKSYVQDQPPPPGFEWRRDPSSAKYSLRPISGGGAQTGGQMQMPRSATGAVTSGPMQAPMKSIAPVTGGIMAPAQRRRAPIMRSA